MPNISTITVDGTNYNVADQIVRDNWNNMQNYVVEQGVYTIGNLNLKYRKWNNGDAEAWGTDTITAAVDTPIGSMHFSQLKDLPFPGFHGSGTALFLEQPTVCLNVSNVASQSQRNILYSTIVLISNTEVDYYISSPVSLSSQDIEINVIIHGRWK